MVKFATKCWILTLNDLKIAWFLSKCLHSCHFSQLCNDRVRNPLKKIFKNEIQRYFKVISLAESAHPASQWSVCYLEDTLCWESWNFCRLSNMPRSYFKRVQNRFNFNKYWRFLLSGKQNKFIHHMTTIVAKIRAHIALRFLLYNQICPTKFILHTWNME